MIALLEAVVKPVAVFLVLGLIDRALRDEGDARNSLESWILQSVKPDQLRPLVGAVAGGLVASYGSTLPVGLNGPFEDFARAESIGFTTPMGTIGWWIAFFVGGALAAKLVARYVDRRALTWKEAAAYTLSGLRVICAVLIVIAVIYKL